MVQMRSRLPALGAKFSHNSLETYAPQRFGACDICSSFFKEGKHPALMCS